MIPRFLLRYFGRLRFPWLFAATAILFLVDLVVVEPIPVVDELLLGSLTLLLGAWRRRKTDRAVDAEEEQRGVSEDAGTSPSS